MIQEQLELLFDWAAPYAAKPEMNDDVPPTPIKEHDGIFYAHHSGARGAKARALDAAPGADSQNCFPFA